MSEHLSRRRFLQISSATAVAGTMDVSVWSASTQPAAQRRPFRGTLCLFSKPVPQLTWKELARQTKQAGFDGIDLTVRSEGHVLPERAGVDLPKAVEAIRAEGLEVPMISTELISADHPTATPIFETASKLSIPFMKPGYYRYKLVDVQQELHQAGQQFGGLARLAEHHGIQLGYHNHTDYIGGSLWDMATVIEPLNPKSCGYYFDLGHAKVDNYKNGWEVTTNLVMPRLKMIGAKDFLWRQTGARQWHADTCPMGQGTVPWLEFMNLLAQSEFHGPISLQQEFPIPGVADDQGIAISRAAIPQVMASAKQGLDYLRSLIHECYETDRSIQS